MNRIPNNHQIKKQKIIKEIKQECIFFSLSIIAFSALSITSIVNKDIIWTAGLTLITVILTILFYLNKKMQAIRLKDLIEWHQKGEPPEFAKQFLCQRNKSFFQLLLWYSFFSMLISPIIMVLLITMRPWLPIWLLVAFGIATAALLSLHCWDIYKLISDKRKALSK